jgi:hypothetical protein
VVGRGVKSRRIGVAGVEVMVDGDPLLVLNGAEGEARLVVEKLEIPE